METTTEEFTQGVRKKGYKFIYVVDDNFIGPVLVEADAVEDGRYEMGHGVLVSALYKTSTPTSDSNLYKYCSPMSETRLYRKFAGLKINYDFDDQSHDMEVISQFANKWGFLGIPSYSFFPKTRELTVDLPKRKGIHCPSTGSSGETLYDWIDEIHKMRSAVWLLDNAALKHNKDVLSERIKWADDKSVVYIDEGYGESSTRPSRFITSDHYRPELLNDLNYQDLRRPALLYLQELINEIIAKHVAPYLDLNLEYSTFGSNTIPSSLLGAMWFQLTLALTEWPKKKWCDVCGKQLKYERLSKQYCSNACRQRYHRTHPTESK